jgi:hypothetical protein
VSPRFWEITIETYGGREGKLRVQNNTRSVNKATQRTTMKGSFYWHVFFVKYVITVIEGTKLLMRPGWTFEIILSLKNVNRQYQQEKAESSENCC